MSTPPTIRRIAWLASAPPADDPVALWTGRILPTLADRVEVDLFTTTPDPDPALERWATVEPAMGHANLWSAVQRSDIAVFHLGNTAKIHGDIFDLSCQHPGLVVCHDPTLHELVAWSWALYQGRVEHYLATVEQEHGATGRALAERWHRGEIDFGELPARLPMTPWIGRRALGVVALDQATYDPLRPYVEAGRLAPLVLAERELSPDDWVDRLLALAAIAVDQRVATAVRVFGDRLAERWDWWPQALRGTAIDQLAVDLAELVRLAEPRR